MHSPGSAGPNDSRFPKPAIIAGGIAFVATAGVVSRLTPDGNLVVTTVPALVVGSAVFGIALWIPRWRRPR